MHQHRPNTAATSPRPAQLARIDERVRLALMMADIDRAQDVAERARYGGAPRVPRSMLDDVRPERRCGAR